MLYKVSLTIQHENHEMLDRFERAFNVHHLCEEFMPCPIRDDNDRDRDAIYLKRTFWREVTWGQADDIGPIFTDNVLKRVGKYRLKVMISERGDRAQFLQFLACFGFVISWEPLLDDPDVFQPDRGTVSLRSARVRPADGL